MNTKNYVFAACLLAGLSLYAQQQPEELDEVVVSDSKFELRRENSGKVVNVITEEQLRQNQGKTVAQVINTLSGVEINGSRSNAGQSLGTYVRGGNNRQVLIVIDGVQVSDPSAIANDYDLRLLDINNIARIEILKGAASTLYGSGAATAVISITTKKASKKKIAASFTSTAGTNEAQENRNLTIKDFQNQVNVNGTLDKLTYTAGFGNQYTDGLSAVRSGSEKDPFSRYNANVKLGYALRENLNVSVYGVYDHFNAAYDNSFPLEDADFDSKTDQKRVGLSSAYQYGKGSLTINAAYNSVARSFISNFPNAYQADSYILDVYNRYNFNDMFYTVLGFNYVEGRTDFGEKKQNNRNTDPYINAVFVSDFGLNFNAGARLNNHNTYGSNLVYNLNPSYSLDMDKGYLKFFGSYATSFITPSLTQLYGPFGANPDLNPETDRSIEGGLEYKIATGFRISGTYFDRREEDFINYVVIDQTTFESQYQNVTTNFSVRGVEAEVVTNPMDKLELRANYTFTENKDKPALRIPKHKANAMLGYNFARASYVSIRYQFTGERTDTDFETGENVALADFSIFDLYLSQKVLDDKLNLFLGLNNVFNKDYQELVGYTTRGRNFRFGFNLTL